MKIVKTLSGLAAAAIASFGIAGIANAALIIEMDSLITGDLPQSGQAPWLTATINNATQNGVSGVTIDLSTSIENPEFITTINFSIIGGTDCSSGTAPAGTGPYQLCVGFAPSVKWDGPTASLFIATLTESSFGANRNGWWGVAHVQGIQPDCSGWIGADGGESPVINNDGKCTPTTVPEPATLALLGLGLAGLGFASRRRRKA